MCLWLTKQMYMSSSYYMSTSITLVIYTAYFTYTRIWNATMQWVSHEMWILSMFHARQYGALVYNFLFYIFSMVKQRRTLSSLKQVNTNNVKNETAKKVSFVFSFETYYFFFFLWSLFILGKYNSKRAPLLNKAKNRKENKMCIRQVFFQFFFVLLK